MKAEEVAQANDIATMYHESNYKSKIVMTAFNKQMETLLVTSEFQDMDLYLQIINVDHLRLYFA